jgi:hypothetical protein
LSGRSEEEERGEKIFVIRDVLGGREEEDRDGEGGKVVIMISGIMVRTKLHPANVLIIFCSLM